MKTNKIVHTLNKRKYFIILFWFSVVIVTGVLFTPYFIENTRNNFEPPENTEAARARNLMRGYFPNKLNESSHIIVVESINGSALNQELGQLTLDIVAFIQNDFQNEYNSIAGYFVFAGTDLDSLKNEFISSDKSTSIIVVNFISDFERQIDIAHELKNFIVSKEYQTINLYLTGFSALEVDTMESLENDMSNIDTFVIPLVVIALIILLKNWRYVPITGITIVMSIILSFGLMERLIDVLGLNIQSFIPSVIISLTIGIGVDYNLFLLSRYREERLNGQSVFDSVVIMMTHAGHTVFTSGFTLFIALFGLIIFPIGILSSVGVAISFSVLILLLVNLTLTPSILLVFGSLIEPLKQKNIKNDSAHHERLGIFYKIGKKATKYNILVIGIILLVTIPPAFQILQSRPNFETNLVAPLNSDSAKGFETLSEKFGPGMLGPTTIIIIPSDNDPWTEKIFNDTQLFISTVLEQTEISQLSISSHTYLNGSKIPIQFATGAIIPESPIYQSKEAQLYRSFALNYISEDNGKNGKAILLSIIFPMDPSSPEAIDLLMEIKAIGSDSFDSELYNIAFTGITADTNATIKSSYELFPFVILLVIIAIYVLIAIMFRALILPARLIATIGLTVSFIYGAATVVFEYNTIINELFPILDNIHVTFWMVPIMTFSIIVGLGIDYDIFTIERIRENIWNGMENNEAIAKGIDKTGRIITGAGIIMMIAFGGLMLSKSYILIQFGFVLAFGVFLDTFVVRTLLVPALMSFAEKYNWWPSSPKISNIK
jgi:RND superfamily putative drug exporter